jgi:hypothetical protein
MTKLSNKPHDAMQQMVSALERIAERLASGRADEALDRVHALRKAALTWHHVKRRRSGTGAVRMVRLWRQEQPEDAHHRLT